MSVEYTVEDRADIIKAAFTKPEGINTHQLDEVLYTLNEAGDLPAITPEQAITAWAAIELVLQNKFTDEMRL